MGRNNELLLHRTDRRQPCGRLDDDSQLQTQTGAARALS
jgi:hypothetical protein